MPLRSDRGIVALKVRLVACTSATGFCADHLNDNHRFKVTYSLNQVSSLVDGCGL